VLELPFETVEAGGWERPEKGARETKGALGTRGVGRKRGAGWVRGEVDKVVFLRMVTGGDR
jgi:hypothetical protein